MKRAFWLPAMIFCLMSCFQNNYEARSQIKTLIEVHNRGWNSVKVYLVRNGVKLGRLGTVEMNQSRVFLVLPNDVQGTGEICLEAFASREVYCTGPLNPATGTYVKITSEQALSMSSFGIYPGRTP